MWITYPLLWSQVVVDKLWLKHSRISPEEVEEAVFDDKPLWRKCGANSYCALGRAVNGRYLLIVLKKKGKNGPYKVLSARDMKSNEKQYYKKRMNQC